MRLFELIKLEPKTNKDLDKFIDTLHKVTQKHPFDPDSRIAWDGKSMIEVRPFGDHINIASIQSLAPAERSGSASALMATAVKIADETGVTLRLSAIPYGTTAGKLNRRQLIAWYKRKGFVPDSTSGAGGMTYTPPVKENITERVSRSYPVIIVDVQPAYASTVQSVGADSVVKELMDFLNAQTGPIIAYYNGAGEGYTEDDEYAVQSYFLENGLGEDQINKIQFIEKTYGFFRTWMDNDVPEHDMIKLLREMNRQGVNDSRDLGTGIGQVLGIGKLLKYQEDWMEHDPIYFPDINVAQLKSMSGALLCGGARHECLKEIQLLLSVYNIRYKLAQDFIYG